MNDELQRTEQWFKDRLGKFTASTISEIMKKGKGQTFSVSIKDYLMEKLAENYKGIWGFDSQNAYDQYGLSYLFDLRSGNTWTGTDAEIWIHKIFNSIRIIVYENIYKLKLVYI